MEPSLSQFFQGDHRSCDEAWAEVEAAVDDGQEAAARAAWERFARAMERHFQMEERVLFPAFEARTGMTGGPTHKMRGVLSQMAHAVAAVDLDAAVELGDTLLILTQQHNMKEEAVLYPMAEDYLGGEWGELHARCATV